MLATWPASPALLEPQRTNPRLSPPARACPRAAALGMLRPARAGPEPSARLSYDAFSPSDLSLGARPHCCPPSDPDVEAPSPRTSARDPLRPRRLTSSSARRPPPAGGAPAARSPLCPARFEQLPNHTLLLALPPPPPRGGPVVSRREEGSRGSIPPARRRSDPAALPPRARAHRHVAPSRHGRMSARCLREVTFPPASCSAESVAGPHRYLPLDCVPPPGSCRSVASIPHRPCERARSCRLRGRRPTVRRSGHPIRHPRTVTLQCGAWGEFLAARASTRRAALASRCMRPHACRRVLQAST